MHSWQWLEYRYVSQNRLCKSYRQVARSWFWDNGLVRLLFHHAERPDKMSAMCLSFHSVSPHNKDGLFEKRSNMHRHATACIKKVMYQLISIWDNWLNYWPLLVGWVGWGVGGDWGVSMNAWHMTNLIKTSQHRMICHKSSFYSVTILWK